MFNAAQFYTTLMYALGFGFVVGTWAALLRDVISTATRKGGERK